jgi:hypothetical protein
VNPSRLPCVSEKQLDLPATGRRIHLASWRIGAEVMSARPSGTVKTKIPGPARAAIQVLIDPARAPTMPQCCEREDSTLIDGAAAIGACADGPEVRSLWSCRAICQVDAAISWLFRALAALLLVGLLVGAAEAHDGHRDGAAMVEASGGSAVAEHGEATIDQAIAAPAVDAVLGDCTEHCCSGSLCCPATAEPHAEGQEGAIRSGEQLAGTSGLLSGGTVEGPRRPPKRDA